MLNPFNSFINKSFHVVMQKDGMQCGVACLSMICSHYGRFYSLNTLSEKCFPTKEGVSMLSISKAANQVGLDNNSSLKF